MNINLFIKILFCTSLLTSNCTRYPKLILTKENNIMFNKFHHFNQPNHNDIVRITDGRYNYYEWKTIDTYRKIGDEDSILITNTIFNENYSDLLDSETISIRKNFLFFIDDHRFIFLSADDRIDSRKERCFELGELFLYFDRKDYNPNKESIGCINQMLRGYYSADGTKIELIFDSKKPFKIKGKYQNQSIVFEYFQVLEDFVENNPKVPALNGNLINLRKIFSNLCLPIFELPNHKDKKDFIFKMGMFKLHNGSSNIIYKMHRDILSNFKKHDIPMKNTSVLIEDIIYRYENVNNSATRRIYRCRFQYFDDKLYTTVPFYIYEEMNDIETW